MPDQKKPKKDRGLGDEIASGVVSLKHPKYAAYKREAEAMGEDVMTPQEWASKQADAE